MAFEAVGFAGIDGNDAHAAEYVGPIGDRLKMLRVDAVAITTKVIQFETFGDCAYESLIQIAMNRY